MTRGLLIPGIGFFFAGSLLGQHTHNSMVSWLAFMMMLGGLLMFMAEVVLSLLETSS